MIDTILAQIADGVLFVDAKGYVIIFNKAAEEMISQRADQVCGHRFSDRFSDTLFGFSMAEALRTQRVPSETFVVLDTRSGEKRELQFQILWNAVPAGILIFIHNITELHRLQRLALRNDRMKELGEMAAMVAHEIRNPLGGIKGFASLLKRDLSAQPSLQKMASNIIEGTEALDRLVSNVLHYARPVKPRFEVTNMYELVCKVCDSVQADSMFDRRIQIHIQAEVKNLVAFVDPQLFRTALMNLVVNAVQAMPEGGKIRISLDQEKSYAVVKVADTGVGIPTEQMSQLFSPLFTTKPSGNGLGLAEVQQVVQAHAGVVEVQSRQGYGSTFTIKIPKRALWECYGN